MDPHGEGLTNAKPDFPADLNYIRMEIQKQFTMLPSSTENLVFSKGNRLVHGPNSTLLVKGTIILFQEFSSVNLVFRAFNDFSRSYLVQCRLLGSAGQFYRQAAIEIV